MDLAQQGIRKAAVLLASLDGPAADALLARLGPEQAAQVRQVVVDLGTIDRREQRRVIDEFFRMGAMVPEKQPPGIEIDDRLARRLAPLQPQPASELGHALPAADARPFRFLRDAEADKLARILAAERPQTIALVLSHLPPVQAGNVLVRLQPAAQAEVVRRLVDLEETDAEILREVERALEARLSQQVRMQRRRVAGMEAIAGILRVADSRVGAHILDSLAAHDQTLAERLRPPKIDFADLAELSDAALTTLLRAADPELTVTALVGALPGLVERILRQFPPHEAQSVRKKIDHPGPIRLSDVEDARAQIAEIARRLSMEGRLELPQHAF